MRKFSSLEDPDKAFIGLFVQMCNRLFINKSPVKYVKTATVINGNVNEKKIRHI